MLAENNADEIFAMQYVADMFDILVIDLAHQSPTSVINMDLKNVTNIT